MTALESGGTDLPVDDEAGATSARGKATVTRRLALGLVRFAFTAAVVIAVAWATVHEWSSVRAYIHTLAWPSVLLALLAVVLGMGTSSLSFRAAVRYTGHDVPVHSAAQIYLVGLLAKYLPGSLWAFVMQMELAKRAKLPRSAAFVASLVAAGLGATAGLVLGLLSAPALLRDNLGLGLAALALVPISLVAACPPVLTWLLRRLMALLRRPVDIPTLTWRAALPIVGWSLATWVIFGCHLWLLASSVGTPGVGGFFLCVGAVALGTTIGVLAFLAPSGMGVREAVIVAALAPYTSAGTALAVALGSRLIFTIGDVVSAGVSAIAASAVRRLQARRAGAIA
jgi:glycosyltransferase 2 family protein